MTVSDSNESCDDTLTDGSGSCQLTITDTGTYSLTANYNGNDFYSSSSDSDLHTVFKADSTTTITGDAPDFSLVNQPFTVTFSVTSTFGLPTGVVSVTVSDSEEDCSESLVEGFGWCQISISTPGTYTLTAAYLGNDSHSPSSDSDMHDVILPKIYLPLVINNNQP